ncbi:MAG TPA: PQQ-binding-like beta-propeller repeat protein [Flavobacteriales bacterium]|nr:PQQ-binding-like beta-propeller repeat protein [Flavobacteriales bacterium]MCB0817723.1 PQQ-binding-like beta-propeller repeat protein [Flavobacteriales bacterium]HOP42874.1 PQQ-binding-like beta-propeller repeat protein [Flavobacteriales bacterium]HPJ53264.1 PQQ-binding-like beta-propeller repeat protein [Flavobacteriales bacterium]HPQ58148.1 PQQ-binding-like beta-propeller repeat protein [Flavobacteriales bacterium]
MKRAVTTSALCLAFSLAFAQEDMSVIWETKLGHKIEHTGTGLEERGYSYAADDKEITVFNNKTGAVRWTGKYKDLAPKLRKVDELIPFWESDCIFLFDRKMGKDQIAVLEMSTGKLLWNTDQYQNLVDESIVYVPELDGFAIALKDKLVWVLAKTGEERWSTDKFKGSVGRYVITGDSKIVMVNFVPSGLGALFTGFKNQIAKVDLVTGEILWENTYIGRAERKVISREFVYDLEVDADKVFLRMNGMQVYDLNTGANVYSAAFDYTPDKVVGAPAGAKKFGIYGAVADPVFVGDDMYVLDMSNKKNQYVKKYDRMSGKLLWTSPEIEGARAIPGMYVVGDQVLLQIGGAVEAQAYIYKRESDGQGGWTITEEWRIWHPEVKPFGIQAFNTSDGSLAWESEKFKKGITNAIVVNGKFIVCSGKELYNMDPATGAEKYVVPVAKGGVGQASMIMPYKDMVVVVGDKGVSTFSTETGEPVASNKYKKSEVEGQNGDFLLMKTAGSDIACFDLNTCQYKEFKAKKGAVTSLTENGGEFVYVYEKKDVTKVATR